MEAPYTTDHFCTVQTCVDSDGSCASIVPSLRKYLTVAIACGNCRCVGWVEWRDGYAESLMEQAKRKIESAHRVRKWTQSRMIGEIAQPSPICPFAYHQVEQPLEVRNLDRF